MRIRNTGRYALNFNVSYKGREVKVVLDRRRLYLDTGNVATTGITDIPDDLYAELKKVKQFVAYMEKGDLAELKADEFITETPEELVKAKDAEIAKLKEELKKNPKGSKKELEAKDKEIASLKEQLEKLGKKDKEAEGF